MPASGIDRSAAHVPAALMYPLRVVLDKAFIQLFAERLGCFVHGRPNRLPEKLIKHRLVEALHEAVGSRAAPPGPPV